MRRTRRVLLDESTPANIRPYLTDCAVDTVPELGWAGFTNGDLIKEAEKAGYDVMVTCDQNIAYQQNLRGRRLALIVLLTNRSLTIRAEIGRVVTAVRDAGVGTYALVEFTRPPLLRRPFTPKPTA